MQQEIERRTHEYMDGLMREMEAEWKVRWPQLLAGVREAGADDQVFARVAAQEGLLREVFLAAVPCVIEILVKRQGGQA